MIIVMGLPGAGKTTVVSNADKRDHEVVNFGDVMFRIAREEYGITDRDEMRNKLSRTEYVSVQEKAGDEIKQVCERSNGRIILDTHAVVPTKDGYIAGLPLKILSRLTVDYLVFVHAPIDEVVARAERDETRRRPLDRELLEKVMKLSETLIACYAMVTGANVVFIENREGRLDEAVERFENVVANDGY